MKGRPRRTDHGLFAKLFPIARIPRLRRRAASVRSYTYREINRVRVRRRSSIPPYFTSQPPLSSHLILNEISHNACSGSSSDLPSFVFFTSYRPARIQLAETPFRDECFPSWACVCEDTYQCVLFASFFALGLRQRSYELHLYVTLGGRVCRSCLWGSCSQEIHEGP